MNLSNTLCITVCLVIVLAAFSTPQVGRRHIDFVLNQHCWHPHEAACFDKLPKDFVTQFADAVESYHLDSMLLDAIPDTGYATYNSDIVPKFPALQRLKVDWFGEIGAELYRRNISVYAYINIGSSNRLAQLSPEFNYKKQNNTDSFEDTSCICHNAPGRLEQLVEVTKEIASKYPFVEAVRYDGLYGFSTDTCRTSGDKAFYKKIFNETLPATWNSNSTRRRIDFWRATSSRYVEELSIAGKSVKNDLMVWFNGFIDPPPWQNHYWGRELNDINTAHRYCNVAFLEFGSVFLISWVRGVIAPSSGVIDGCLLQPPFKTSNTVVSGAWESVANNGLMYQYFGIDGATGLPDPKGGGSGPAGSGGGGEPYNKTAVTGFLKAMAERDEVQGGDPVGISVGILYSDNTRKRYVWFDRSTYMAVHESLFKQYLDRFSLNLEFVNSIELDGKLDDVSMLLSRFSILILVESSGFSDGALSTIRSYVNAGGHILVSGDATLFDTNGKRRSNFALADVLGLSFQDTYCTKDQSIWNVIPTPDGGWLNTFDEKTWPRTGRLSSQSCVNNAFPLNGTDTKIAATLSIYIDKKIQHQSNLVTTHKYGNGTAIWTGVKWDAPAGVSNLTMPIISSCLDWLIGDGKDTPLGLGAGLPFITRKLPSTTNFTVSNFRSEVVISALKGRLKGSFALFFLRNDDLEVTVDANMVPMGNLKVSRLYPPNGWNVEIMQTSLPILKSSSKSVLHTVTIRATCNKISTVSGESSNCSGVPWRVALLSPSNFSDIF